MLWEIRCSSEDDVGFHSAAHIELLSQHPAEKEVLFPPLTMLQVGVRGFSAFRVKMPPVFMTLSAQIFVCR